MGFNSFSDSLLVLMEESLSKLKDLRLPTVQMFNVPESVSTNILMTLEPATIAMYLTYFDFETFQKIQVGVVGWLVGATHRNAMPPLALTQSLNHAQPTELLKCAWSKPKAQYSTCHVRAFTNRINRLSMWVATCILSFPTAEHRAATVEKFIHVAEVRCSLSLSLSLLLFLSDNHIVYIGCGNSACESSRTFIRSWA